MNHKPLLLNVTFASLGGLLMGYDIGLIGCILLFIKDVFHLSNLPLGLTASIIVPGTMAGALMMNVIAHRLHRRTWMLISAVIAFFALLFCSFAQLPLQIILGRFVLGIAIGISLVNVPLYLRDISPLHRRGFAVAFFQLAVTFGIMVGSGIGYWLSHYGAWRIMFVSGTIVAVMQLLGALLLPSVSSQDAPPSVSRQLASNTNKSHRSKLIIGNTLALLHQFTGINAIVYFAPFIFKSSSSTSLTLATKVTWIMLCANFLFTILSLDIFDRFGKRNILLGSFLLQCLALAGLGISLIFFHPTPYVMLALMLVYLLGFAAGLGPGLFIVAAELYSSELGSKAMSMTIFFNNVAAFIVICSFPFLLASLGISSLFCLYAAIAFLGLVFVGVCGL